MGRALIVSAGANSNEYISARLAEQGYPRPLTVPSGAEARRRILESDFELIVVNAPLPDEFGHELCADAVEKTDAGVLLLAKAAAAEVPNAPKKSAPSGCASVAKRAERSGCARFRKANSISRPAT